MLQGALNAVMQYRDYYDSVYSTSDAAAISAIYGGSMLVYLLCCCFWLVIALVISYLVYKDAQKNNVDNPMLWAIVTFFLGLIGVVIYLLVARNNAKPASSAPVMEAKEDKPAK